MNTELGEEINPLFQSFRHVALMQISLSVYEHYGS